MIDAAASIQRATRRFQVRDGMAFLLRVFEALSAAREKGFLEFSVY